MNIFVKAALAFAALAVIPATVFCRPILADSAASTVPRFSALEVFPQQIVLSTRQSHRVLVTGLSSNGFEKDLTGNAIYESDNLEIASVDASGRVQALKPGVTRIIARHEQKRVSLAVKVNSALFNEQISFINDVLPVLSKAGCNAGSCHAKAEGQNGFKLSVFAYDPKSDYDQIVRASRGRRVFPGAPEESLLLKKPTMAVNHGGGRRLEASSEQYRDLVEWIKQGLPFAHPNDPLLQEIQVYPRERRYQKGATQPLLVQAHYSDGRIRDVTHLADFRSSEKEIAQVDEQGLVTVGTLSGDCVVMARFMGLVNTSRITIPADRLLPDSFYAALPIHNQIDSLVYAQHKKFGLLASAPCTDSEFIRRASLDSIGMLPSAEDVRAFLNDRTSEKRARLIDRLLSRPAYANLWATKWADLIRPNPSRVGVKSVYLLDLWLRESFRLNKPYDQFARELLMAQGSTHKYGPAVLFRDRREPADVSSFVSQIFLGVRLECAKCHHHPNEKWSQADYFQLAAYFSQIKRKGQGISAPISGEAEFIYFAPGGAVNHPVTGEALNPKPPDGSPPHLEPGSDPREALAGWISHPDNPFFARAVANRIWSQFMGRGIVDPVDDFRASNPPSNEALLNWLASDFVQHGYDLKHLMRTIMQSHVYQLSSIPNEYNLSDTRNFSRSYRRRLPAEVLLDAVSDVTGTPESFQGLPEGARAIETWNHKLDSEFMDAFGRPNSSAECPCERDTKNSVVQALHLMNSNRLQAKIASPGGRAHQFADGKLPAKEIVTELYLAAFSRFPTEDELKIACEAFNAPGETRQSATEDIMWAVINSAEFVFNH